MVKVFLCLQCGTSVFVNQLFYSMFYSHNWLIQVGLQNDRLDGSMIGVIDMSQPSFEVNDDINYDIHIPLWLKEIIL